MKLAPSETVISAEGPVTYHLCGVVEHIGRSVTRGHYEVLVKRGGSWFKASDMNVSCTSREMYLTV